RNVRAFFVGGLLGAARGVVGPVP
ncbi:hypothetical protein A2U01_0112714, partial [Trifolium medium]|nr:hypothetical protein [Trifolium medium]